MDDLYSMFLFDLIYDMHYWTIPDELSMLLQPSTITHFYLCILCCHFELFTSPVMRFGRCKFAWIPTPFGLRAAASTLIGFGVTLVSL